MSTDASDYPQGVRSEGKAMNMDGADARAALSFRRRS